jgi:hypothetical protein
MPNPQYQDWSIYSYFSSGPDNLAHSDYAVQPIFTGFFIMCYYEIEVCLTSTWLGFFRVSYKLSCVMAPWLISECYANAICTAHGSPE